MSVISEKNLTIRFKNNSTGNYLENYYGIVQYSFNNRDRQKSLQKAVDQALSAGYLSLEDIQTHKYGAYVESIQK